MSRATNSLTNYVLKLSRTVHQRNARMHVSHAAQTVGCYTVAALLLFLLLFVHNFFL